MQPEIGYKTEKLEKLNQPFQSMMWIAFLTDNQKLFQFNPESQPETSFKEVLKAEQDDRLLAFELHSLTPIPKIIIGVSLQTGLFNFNGLAKNEHPSILLDELDLPLPDIKYRLVYYRRNRGEIGGGGISNNSTISNLRVHRYLIGWQITYQGYNYQRIAFYDPETRMIRTKEKR